MTSESYLTPPEAARYLRISTSTLSKFRVYGGGPTFTRVGRAIRYPLTSLNAYMAARLVHSTSEKRLVLDQQQVRDEARVLS
jgi:excisionase family DNA binding protein